MQRERFQYLLTSNPAHENVLAYPTADVSTLLIPYIYSRATTSTLVPSDSNSPGYANTQQASSCAVFERGDVWIWEILMATLSVDVIGGYFSSSTG